MIDTKELRRLVQAAISKMNARDPEFASSVTPLAVLELLDRLEAAESECLEQARLNGMGASREAALIAKLEAAEKERDFAKTEIARLHDDIRELTDVRVLDAEDRDRIVAWRQGTSAQPAPSVPEYVMRDAERYRYLRARDDGTAGVGCWIEADGRVCYRGWLYGVQLDSAIDSFIEVLAAAPKPEVKP